jgi:hypothetical protein
MTSVSTSPFHISMLRKANTWYSVKDGNFTDPFTWMSNAKKKYAYPQPGDNVYINHAVVVNTNINVKNATVSGALKLSGDLIFTVNGDLQATGTVDQAIGNNTIVLKGINNFIITFIPGSAGTVEYGRAGTAQFILPLPYCNLTLSGPNKYLLSDTTITRNLSMGTILNTLNYDLNVFGNTNVNIAASMIISSGKILFGGIVSNGGGKGLDIIGEASIELRNGVTGAGFDWPNSNINCTTNNQYLTSSANTFTVNNITITGAITIYNAAGSIITTNGFINGTTPDSTFNNNGSLILKNNIVPMSTGTFNHKTTVGSSMTYHFNGDYTLPYTNYHYLTIKGTGVKSLSGNTIINNDFAINTSSVIELGNYDFTVIGKTVSTGNGLINKSGTGNVLFIGNMDINSSITFLSNPIVELRGGINITGGVPNFGTGTLIFTTNSQTLTNGFDGITFDCAVYIDSGITITHTSQFGIATTFKNSLAGGNNSSTFINRGIVRYLWAEQPMQTGILNCNVVENLFIYGSIGLQDITPGVYRSLTINGSGNKKLLGNVSVVSVYTIILPATLNENGFVLTNH